ncbi:MAG: hypothetical protein HYX39_05910 [Bacteroidetes bacterium]|nr:hypothetical protein [Bacteroidota bacterium]
MKKSIQAVIILLVVGFISNSYAQSFAKQQIDINFGVGIGNTFIKSGASKVLPVISTSFDYGITDAISIGAYLGYSNATYNFNGRNFCPSGNGNGNAFGNYFDYTDTYTYKFSIVGLRGAYHFAKFINSDKTDVYLGAMAGANLVQSTYSTNDPCAEHIALPIQKYNGFIYSGYAGVRYRFTENIGIFAELGYGISYATLGINFKF